MASTTARGRAVLMVVVITATVIGVLPIRCRIIGDSGVRTLSGWWTSPRVLPHIRLVDTAATVAIVIVWYMPIIACAGLAVV